MTSYDQYCPETRQKCSTPYECAIKCRLNKPEPECCNGECNEGRNCPKRRIVNWKDISVDLICMFVWWAWIIPVLILVGAVAGLFFGFFG